MNATTTKKIALAALAAPALTAIAIGFAGAAHAGEQYNTTGGTTSASDTIGQLRDQGMRVVVNRSGLAGPCCSGILYPATTPYGNSWNAVLKHSHAARIFGAAAGP